MNDQKRQSRFTYANAMVTLLAFVVLGGTAVAGGIELGRNSVGPAELSRNSVDSSEIRRAAVEQQELAAGSVRTRHIANGQVTRPKLAPDAIGSDEVARNALTGDDVDESSLNVLRPDGCQAGSVRGFARVPAPSAGSGVLTPSTYTSSSTYITDTHNCSGQPVSVRTEVHSIDGKPHRFPIYYVRFPGSGAEVASVTLAESVNDDGEFTMPIAFSAVRIDSGPDAGAFRVDGTFPSETEPYHLVGNEPFQIAVF